MLNIGDRRRVSYGSFGAMLMTGCRYQRQEAGTEGYQDSRQVGPYGRVTSRIADSHKRTVQGLVLVKRGSMMAPAIRPSHQFSPFLQCLQIL